MKRFILFLLLLLCRTPAVTAQVQVPADSAVAVQSSFFPILGYGSDVGFLGGGVYSRFDYRESRGPFRNHLEILGAVSTRGFVKFESLYEHTRTFGSDIRSEIQGFVNRRSYDNYFGIGNATGFSENRWENEFYYFESVHLEWTYLGRKSLVRTGRNPLDWSFGIGMEYEIPYMRQPNSRFAMDNPPGRKGGWLVFLKTGLVRDTRDNEFDAGSGNRSELSLRYAPELLLSDFEVWVIDADFRQFATILNSITAAGRVKFRHAGGASVPYWELSALGEDNSLRGYPRNRFMGATSIEYNLELRTWLFEFPGYGIKLGGQLFTDVGRVFTEQDDFNDLFRNYKQTFGFGGAISLFNPDFILRGDVGFSEDTFQIYIGTGYIF